MQHAGEAADDREGEEGVAGDTRDPDVVAAVGGDREALERVVRRIQPDVHQLALRFFGHPAEAEDATQEALVQVVTKLDRFRGDSAFSTWVYRVATNKFLSMSRTRSERDAVGFADFDDILARHPEAHEQAAVDVDEQLLAEEVKIGCTLAMLLCLDRPHRMAYILGEVMELDHRTAAEILDTTSAAYRKRLQRARQRITGLMRERCGLFDPANPCRCRLRAPATIASGCVDPDHLVYATSAEQARRFPVVLHHIRRLEEANRAGALYRSHPQARPVSDLASFVAELFPA